MALQARRLVMTPKVLVFSDTRSDEIKDGIPLFQIKEVALVEKTDNSMEFDLFKHEDKKALHFNHVQGLVLDRCQLRPFEEAAQPFEETLLLFLQA